jgi:L-fuconolactonase
MDIIDAHHHVWDLAVRDQGWIDPIGMAVIRRDFTLEDLARVATPVGVGGTVVVQTVPEAGETPELLERASRNPLVLGVVGWVDLTRPDLPEELARLRAVPGGDRLVGVRHLVQDEPDPDWLGRPDVRRGLRAVAAAGLRYDLLVREPQWPAAVAVARDLPELTLILDHLAKPPVATDELSRWAGHIADLGACPNVAAKLSGLVTEAEWDSWTPTQLRPYAATALAAFGPDRVMYGSDWPVCLLAAEYAEVLDLATGLTAGLSAAERAEVFAGTARRWYGLPAVP